MRVIFLGTPEFAVPSLRALHDSNYDVAAVYTQPDRPKGRGNQLSTAPVKLTAADLGLPVFQPERIRRPEVVEQLREFRPELMVVVGYGQIIPQAVIDIPRHGIVNVHASLLPALRGAAPIQWAIANGETETGVTIMQIDAGLDTGDMLSKGTLAVGPDETSPELAARLAPLGASLLIEVIRQLEEGSVRRYKQDPSQATHAPILKKEDGRIDWSQPALTIYNRLRGFTPWPGAFTTFRAQPLQVNRAKPDGSAPIREGRFHIAGKKAWAGCGGGTALELLEVQPAGKKQMSIEAFLNGYKPTEQDELGAAH